MNQAQFQGLALPAYLKLSIQAVRFDLSSIFSINLIYLFLSLLPFSFVCHKNYKVFLQSIFILFNSIAFLFDLSDIAYYPYVLKRMSADVFDLMGNRADFLDLLPSYLTKFWFVPLLASLFLALFIWLNVIIEKRYPCTLSHFSVKKLIRSFMIMAISIVLIRGGLQLKPIVNSNALLITKSEYAAIALNTPFSILHSLGQNSLSKYSFYPMDEVYRMTKPLKCFSHRPKMNNTNVVLIIVESFGKAYTGFGNRKSYTPFFDSLSKHGCLFTQAYANAFRSADGIPACIAGIPSMMEEPFTTSKYATCQYEALPALLKKKGYASSFFHGGTNGTMSFDIFSKSAGFDRYVGRTEFGNDEYYDGTWGIWDEPFLQFFSTSLNNEKQPFFSSIFTLSSHEPFLLPKKYQHSEMAKLNGMERGIAYTDEALKLFFKQAAQSKWYKNTLFVITADHNFMANYDSTGYYNSGMGLYAIPTLLFHPSDVRLKGVNDKVFQQIDILPTILDYLNYPLPFFSFGNSAFDSTANRMAFNYMSGLNQFLMNGFVLKSYDTNVQGLYNYSSDSLLKVKLMNDSVEESLTKTFRLYKQLFNFSLIENRLTPQKIQGTD